MPGANCLAGRGDGTGRDMTTRGSPARIGRQSGKPATENDFPALGKVAG